MCESIARRSVFTRALAILFAATITAALPVHGSAAKDSSGTDKVFRIGFHIYKPGKIYDEAMAGIRDGLDLEGIRYEAVVVQSNRDNGLAEHNLRRMDKMGLDLIYSLSSAGTKIVKRLKMKTPVIATVINHPASLGIGQEGSRAGTRLTGTSYYVDAKKQLALYRNLFPDIDRVGMIFDANNPAGALAEEPFMRIACKEAGLRFVSAEVRKPSDLASAAKSLIDADVDVIVIPTNRLVYGNLGKVLAVTNKRHVPVVSMNKQGVENGALAALFADTYNLGRLTAGMARRILLEERDPASISFAYIDEPNVILNLSSASTLNYEFPADVLGGAAIVLQ